MFREYQSIRIMKMENSDELHANWKETKAKLKQKFAILTDSDLLLVEGKQDEMLNRLELKLGRSKEEMYKIILKL